VGFRLREAEGGPGIYLPGLFKTVRDAEKYRAGKMNDPEGKRYAVQEVNWRSARL
jgi:hypothetical protein